MQCVCNEVPGVYESAKGSGECSNKCKKTSKAWKQIQIVKTLPGMLYHIRRKEKVWAKQKGIALEPLSGFVDVRLFPAGGWSPSLDLFDVEWMVMERRVISQQSMVISLYMIVYKLIVVVSIWISRYLELWMKSINHFNRSGQKFRFEIDLFIQCIHVEVNWFQEFAHSWITFAAWRFAFSDFYTERDSVLLVCEPVFEI